MQIAVKDRQSLADIAVEYLGGVEGIFALAERNGISITARLEDGQTLDWELADTVDAQVQKTYAAQGIEPATDISAKETNALLQATARYIGGCIIPPRPWRDWLIVDEATQVKGDAGKGLAALRHRLTVRQRHPHQKGHRRRHHRGEPHQESTTAAQ
jgi:hypothetical protein